MFQFIVSWMNDLSQIQSPLCSTIFLEFCFTSLHHLIDLQLQWNKQWQNASSQSLCLSWFIAIYSLIFLSKYFILFWLLQCIGATTLDEYRKHVEKDPALERRFQPVKVPEPSVDETIQILKGLRERYEIHHKLRYTDEALVAAAQLSYQYIRFVIHVTAFFLVVCLQQPISNQIILFSEPWNSSSLDFEP